MDFKSISSTHSLTHSHPFFSSLAHSHRKCHQHRSHITHHHVLSFSLSQSLTYIHTHTHTHIHTRKVNSAQTFHNSPNFAHNLYLGEGRGQSWQIDRLTFDIFRCSFIDRSHLRADPQKMNRWSSSFSSSSSCSSSSMSSSSPVSNTSNSYEEGPNVPCNIQNAK